MMCKSSTKLFKTAAELHEKEDKFRNSIVANLLKAIVFQHYTGVHNVKKEARLVDLHRYLREINNQSCKFVSANLGFNGTGISD